MTFVHPRPAAKRSNLPLAVRSWWRADPAYFGRKSAVGSKCAQAWSRRSGNQGIP